MTTPLPRSTSTSATDLADLKEKEIGPYSGFKWFLVCIAIYSSAFLYGLDNTIVADIQAAAVEDFGAVEKLGWLGIGFPLGSIATILSIGKAFGTFDVKWLYIASLVMFETGSALCGGAPNMEALIVGRVWAGAGGAGMYLGVLNIIAINTTLHERPMYMGLTGLVWGAGCILGPVIGGGFADSSATWRWAFYINLVIFACFVPVYLFVLDSFQPQPNASVGQKLKHMDWLGVVLNAGVYVSFVMFFTFGGTLWSWDSGWTIALFVVFGVIVLTFALTQGFSFLTTPDRRLFPVDFLWDRTLVLMYIATAAGATSLFVPIYYIPLYFSFVHGDSGVEAAVRLLPFICLCIFGAMFNGALMPKFGYYMPWYVASEVLILIGGSTMYAAVDISTPNAHIYGFSILLGLGSGLSQRAAYSVAPAVVKPNRASDAVGFINTAQIGAIVISLTITSSVFQNIGFRHVKNALKGTGFSTDDIHAALAGVKSDVFTSATPEIREKVLEGIVRAISDAYILVIVAGAVTLVCSVFMKREKLFMEVTAGG